MALLGSALRQGVVLGLDSAVRMVHACRSWVAHRHELAAAGALLTCLAVVLNVSPFAKGPNRDAVPSAAAQSIGSASLARWQGGAGARLDRLRSGLGVMDGFESLRPVIAVSSIPDDAFARMVFRPVAPKDRDGEMQARLAGQDRAMFDPAAQPLAAIAGVWVPDAAACSARYLREGLLPTIINTDGAWAGETFCIFKNQKQTDTGWKVVANCSNPREHWTTDVRLTIKDNRLIWASRRGTQSYTRCAADFLLAAAR
jgi:hypothetical protein